MSKISALQTGRFYKVKNPQKNFLCALCSAPRQMKYSKHLSSRNYVQIIILSVSVSSALFPVMGEKSLFMVFPIWMIWEIANKMLYRKDIPCPYCGFDATWYRRDVNVANQKVKTFWQQNYPELVNKPEALMDEEISEVQNTVTSEQKEHVAESHI